MVAGLLICGAAGAALGLAGCRSRGARAWIVHATMAAAMLAMLLPAVDPFGASGPLVWALALGCLAIWTGLDRTGSDRDVPGHPATTTRDLLDLWAMVFLLLLMPGLHSAPAPNLEPAPNPGPLGIAHGDHTVAGAGALEVRGVVLALIVSWLAALVWLSRHERRARLPATGSALSAATMAGMALSF